MSLIYVRAKEGRVARVSPKGKYIPNKGWLGVTPSPYLSRLADFHGDIEISEVEPKEEKTDEKDGEIATATKPKTK